VTVNQLHRAPAPVKSAVICAAVALTIPGDHAERPVRRLEGLESRLVVVAVRATATDCARSVSSGSPPSTRRWRPSDVSESLMQIYDRFAVGCLEAGDVLEATDRRGPALPATARPQLPASQPCS
jgi:hypothetical protein